MRLATTTLVFCVTALLALGLVMLYSSSMADRDGTHDFVMQLAWCAIGITACVGAALLDYRLWKKYTWLLFGAAMILLILVLVIGMKMNGARRWFRLPIGGMRFQPSEAGKIALILALAWYGEHFQRRMTTWKWGIVIPAIFTGLALGLIFVEPDRGTTILLGCVTGAMLFLACVRWNHLIVPIGLGALLLTASLLHDPVRRERLRAWINPNEHRMTGGLQADHAALALGSGGWTGVGLGNSRQKLGYLPFHNTDFILPIIGEELGLVATLGVVAAFMGVVVCGFYISWRSGDTFGLLLGSGITLMIGLQAALNIGVVTGVLPNKGIPLPFISYGGSNLLIMLASVGLLLSIARRARLRPAAARMPGDQMP
jgi:cell division protein FtsW